VPGYGAGVFTEQGSLASFIDHHLISGALWNEGPASTPSWICIILWGSLAGHWLRSNRRVYPEGMLKSLSIIAYFGMVGGLVGLLTTKYLFSASLFVIAPQVAALLLMIWARITFGRRSFHVAANPTAGGLVTTGPYRFIRHPIYTAVCLFTVPGAVAHWTWFSALLGALVVASALVRMLFEEKLLVARYPEYGQYVASTSRMIPFLF
jgi:protein-S-isoprenylcysteine O-methyltransferase Ste14